MGILTALFHFLSGYHHRDLSGAFTICERSYKASTPSKIALALVLGLLAAGTVPTPVRGQSSAAAENETATAEIPFEFLTLDTRCPAGSYSVTFVGPTQLLMRNEEKHVAVQIFTVSDPEFPVDGKKPRLIFVQRDGKEYFVGIVTSHGFERVSGLFGIKRKEGDVRTEIELHYAK